ncbi:hypothetical protein BKA70DRAFT_1433996 [Coprinopsis sp. MPI-PUGE-AT-0042]|nr:hypothetical protein BKA70DRAFT_1433996 [Coprinopsis sp. MPI-PUGE-AT-0042]
MPFKHSTLPVTLMRHEGPYDLLMDEDNTMITVIGPGHVQCSLSPCPITDQGIPLCVHQEVVLSPTPLCHSAFSKLCDIVEKPSMASTMTFGDNRVGNALWLKARTMALPLSLSALITPTQHSMDTFTHFPAHQAPLTSYTYLVADLCSPPISIYIIRHQPFPPLF